MGIFSRLNRQGRGTAPSSLLEACLKDPALRGHPLGALGHNYSVMRYHPPALFDYRWHVLRVGAARVACARGACGSTVATIFLGTLIIAIFSANFCTIAACVTDPTDDGIHRRARAHTRCMLDCDFLPGWEEGVVALSWDFRHTPTHSPTHPTIAYSSTTV